MAQEASRGLSKAYNKRMHATRDTNLVMLRQRLGGRVMRGVMRFLA